MSLKDYKRLGIEHFYKKDYKNAKIFFSLAYEKRKNKKLLHFISICDLALKNEKEAIAIFDFYMANYSYDKIYIDVERILSFSEARENLDKNLKEDESFALSYKDFLQSEKKLGFKKSFENIIFSSKLIISDKNDFLDFLEKLLENGYDEFILNYIEYMNLHFVGNTRFEKIAKRLKLINDTKI